MTLRIQCPSCERQFRVSEELKGRTVECGGCEHRFKLDDEVMVARRDKFYPGESKKPGLEGFGRAQQASGAPVAFETAAYNQTQSVDDFIPVSPQQMMATLAGALVMALTAVMLVLGTQKGGIFQDVEVGKRAMLCGFIVVVGISLVLYGCIHRRRMGILLSVFGAAAVMTLSLLLPVPRTIEQGEFVELPGNRNQEDEDRPPDRVRRTPQEVMDLVGYGPIQRAIVSRTTAEMDGAQLVSALWVPVMEERFKFQILKYLHRKTGTRERPSFYRRDNGGIFVIDGSPLSLERIAGLVERFGRVEDVYPEIRVIEVTVEGGRLIEASKELVSKLTDKEHPAFYVRNMQELDHIDLDRVAEAVHRLAEAEPKRFRVEISRRLIELMAEEADSDFKGQVARALSVWSEPGDGAETVVAETAREVYAAEEAMPRSILEFLVVRKSPEVIPVVEQLWVQDPSSWEPVIAGLGSAAEDAVLRHLGDDGRGIQQSALRLLKRMGSTRSIATLRSMLDGADDELKILLQDTIDSIQSGS